MLWDGSTGILETIVQFLHTTNIEQNKYSVNSPNIQYFWNKYSIAGKKNTDYGRYATIRVYKKSRNGSFVTCRCCINMAQFSGLRYTEIYVEYSIFFFYPKSQQQLSHLYVV